MRFRGLVMGLAGAVAAWSAPLPAQQTPATPQAGAMVDTLLVRGNQRVPEPAVRATSGLQGRTRVTAVDVQRAIHRLMSTGNFASVQILGDGDPSSQLRLVIQVEERPLIASYDFRGLRNISAKSVRDTLKLADNQPLNPNTVIQTERMIRDLLARQGVQVRSIDTVLTPVPAAQGTFRLAFDVEEGNRLAIADVVFEGNQAFSDESLQGAMATKPEGFLWFRSGRFDRETFREDLRKRLPDFYAERGYIDFAVVSDTLIVDPETGKARLSVQIAEGPQYRLGEFKIEGNSRFPTEQLARYFTSESRTVLGLPFGGQNKREQGEVFNRVALQDASAQIRKLYNNEGYLYAQIEPVLARVPATGGQPARVDVTWAISERQPFYIRNVAIQGNTTTHESVIRDRLVVFPGDVYNEDRLLQSYQSIGALGFFETPMPTPDILPNPETGEVDLVFHVKEKQTGNINFGTSIGGGYYGRSGGLSGFLGYSQPNLFGQGKTASLRAEYGWGRNTFEASYTDPALFGTRNSGSVSIFHASDRYSPFNDGRRVQTGASLQYGFPLPNLRWTRAFLGYRLARSRYDAVDENCSTTESIFCLPSATAGTFSFNLARDTKNHPIFPSVGTRQSLLVSQTGGPAGGEGNFRKLLSDLEWWVPVGQLGGGGAPGQRPMRFALGLQARGGAIFGDPSFFPLERFFLGGTTFGQPLRGYEESTVTPFGYIPRNSSFPSSRRIGDAFLTVSAEYALRLNDNLSVSLFGDAGNVWSDPSQIDPTRLFRGAGLGATVVTPFGPIGLDYAYGFDKTEPGWQLHFKFGQGF